jgi:hypothetical protein
MTSLLTAQTVPTVASQTPPVTARQAALNDFARRLQAYLSLRGELENELQPLSPKVNASELRARRLALAARLRNARMGARHGDLIPLLVQKQIRETVLADLKRRSPAERNVILEEMPTGPLPGINRNYPVGAALPTVSPLLLACLPTLPETLEYRFFSRHVIVLDLDVEIVVDYVANAVPSQDDDDSSPRALGQAHIVDAGSSHRRSRA